MTRAGRPAEQRLQVAGAMDDMRDLDCIGEADIEDRIVLVAHLPDQPTAKLPIDREAIGVLG